MFGLYIGNKKMIYPIQGKIIEEKFDSYNIKAIRSF